MIRQVIAITYFTSFCQLVGRIKLSVVSRAVYLSFRISVTVTHLSEAVYLIISRPRGVLPYMGYTGMCCPKGYGFSAVLVINRVWFLHSNLDILKPLTNRA